VKVIRWEVHQRSRWSLMNSLPLSESMPSSGNGNPAWISTSAQNTCRAALVRTLRTSVQPVAMSVTVSEGEVAVVVPALVTDQVDLDEPRPGLVPVGPGPHRDLRLQQ
jgi:hypothetical protein